MRTDAGGASSDDAHLLLLQQKTKRDRYDEEADADHAEAADDKPYPGRSIVAQRPLHSINEVPTCVKTC